MYTAAIFSPNRNSSHTTAIRHEASTQVKKMLEALPQAIENDSSTKQNNIKMLDTVKSFRVM